MKIYLNRRNAPKLTIVRKNSIDDVFQYNFFPYSYSLDNFYLFFGANSLSIQPTTSQYLKSKKNIIPLTSNHLLILISMQIFKVHTFNSQLLSPKLQVQLSPQKWTQYETACKTFKLKRNTIL